MGRMIGGVVLGYVVMAASVMVTYSIAYVLMGADGAFQPGSYRPTGVWLAVSFILAFIAAIAGGLTCTAVARNPKGPMILAGAVVVLGLLFAIPVLTAQDAASELRTSEVSNFEAMQKAKEPGWVALATPFVGVAGVLIGARLKRG